jgi:hypothetical protein
MMNSMSDLLQDRIISTAATNEAGAQSQMQAFSRTIGAEHAHHPAVGSNASSVPGFPQDAFMEMGMDAAVAKPETAGLAPNWSAGMMGMMSLVRVLPDARYDEIVSRFGGRS